MPSKNKTLMLGQKQAYLTEISFLKIYLGTNWDGHMARIQVSAEYVYKDVTCWQNSICRQITRQISLVFMWLNSHPALVSGVGFGPWGAPVEDGGLCLILIWDLSTYSPLPTQKVTYSLKTGVHVCCSMKSLVKDKDGQFTCSFH